MMMNCEFNHPPNMAERGIIKEVLHGFIVDAPYYKLSRACIIKQAESAEQISLKENYN